MVILPEAIFVAVILRVEIFFASWRAVFCNRGNCHEACPDLPLRCRNYIHKSGDAIDEKIQALIVERAICATEIAKAKQENVDIQQPYQQPVFYRPERETQVLKAILARPCGPVHPEDMARLFREVMSMCLALEQPMKIAYLGPHGTFTEAAAMKHFGRAVHGVSLATTEERLS